MAEVIHIDLLDNGGPQRFRTWDELRTFAEREREVWAWLWNGSWSDRVGVGAFVQQRWNWLWNEIQTRAQENQAVANIPHVLSEVYLSNERILHSKSVKGQQILDIQAEAGADSAGYAYGLTLNRTNLTTMQTVADLRGAALLAVPGMQSPSIIAEQLQRERKNLRDRADRLANNMEDAERQERADFQASRRQARQLAFRYARRFFGRWKHVLDEGVAHSLRQQTEFGQLSSATQGEFEATRKAYSEAMRLLAPVEYWEKKAAKHQTAETWAMWRLLAFFPVAALGLGTAFWEVGKFLITSDLPAKAGPIYVVASAGLGSLAAIVFWVGRLLTRLYLSEHHLRHDAEERAVMTETYLALMKESAATDADRTIILTALFRNVTDGIVKDEGGALDPNLAMLLSKLGMPGKAG